MSPDAPRPEGWNEDFERQVGDAVLVKAFRDEPSALAWALSVLDAQGQVMFTAHYQLALARAADGTRLALKLRIADSTVASAPYIAGIETGWGQVLDQLVRAIAAFGPAGRPVRRPSIRRSST